MTIQEVGTSSLGERVTTYIFNNIEYSHVGQWPPVHVPGFHVPIATVTIIDTNEDVTAQVKRFAGPRHVVTRDIIRYALGTWSWTIACRVSSSGISFYTKPYLRVQSHVPTVRVINVLGQESIF